MKYTYLNIILWFSIYSCHNSSTTADKLNNLCRESQKVNDEFNLIHLKQDKFVDSLYKIAELNLDSGIIAIDNVITESPNYAPFYKMKGDFYFKYHEYQNAKVHYSKALELDEFSNALVFRASCYLNLKQYDSCLIDLRSFPQYNKANYWYFGNYYEARLNLDSAIHCYEILYKEDNGVYKYCKDRIDYLRKNTNSKLFKELMIRDTARWTIQLY